MAVLALVGGGIGGGVSGMAVATSDGGSSAVAASGGDAVADASGVRAEAAARRKVVRVRDNFFSPARTRVRRGTRMVWRWPRSNVNRHNVVLTRAPRGVRRFSSKSAVRGYRFARRLRRPGRYAVICTFHSNMKMAIRVRRR